MKTNPKVDEYLKRAKKWRAEMEELRGILLSRELQEELKWGKACYTFQGSNVVIMVGFKEHCALIFCKGALLKDPKKILILPGENTQAARQMRFTSVGQIAEVKEVLKAYIKEAIEAERAGLEVQYKTISEFAIPEELQSKWEARPALEKAFRALTPGRQRGYIIYFSAAKQPKTRIARIEKCTERILAGKGLSD
jgi:uncharacterized protein YdeI (YjbR/CyaY-like superfamily)